MHHRRFHFQVAAIHEEFAYALDHFRSDDKHVTRRLVGDEVHVTLAVLLLLVREAVEFLGQGPQRLGEQAEFSDLHRQLTSLGFEQVSLGAENVTEVVVLEGSVCRLAGEVVADVELDAAAGVLQRGKARLAHDPLQHHAAGDGNIYERRRQIFLALSVVGHVQFFCRVLAGKIVGEGETLGAQIAQLGAALLDDLVGVLRLVLFVGHL